MKRILYLLVLIPFAVQAQTISTIAGGGTGGDSVQATASMLGRPWGVAYDHLGNMYISDADNSTIRKVSSSGIITTVAGNGVSGYSGDNGPATDASIGFPMHLAVDAYNNLYIPDLFNHCVRKVNTAGIITTVVGTGYPLYSGDGGPATAAAVNSPSAVTFDSSGNMYVADAGNHRIRKIDVSGIITPYPLGSSPMNINGFAFDHAQNLYVADANATVKIISPSGTISTFAGSGAIGYSGDGGPATNASFNGVSAVTVDMVGNVYVSDDGNSLVRKINTSGVISTVTGSPGIFGFSGDGGLASLATINAPSQLVINQLGELVFCDRGSNRIRKIGTDLSGLAGIVLHNTVSVYPNPAHDYANVTLGGNTTGTLQLYNGIGQLVATQQAVGKARIDLSHLPVGLYMLKVVVGGNSSVHKLLKN